MIVITQANGTKCKLPNPCEYKANLTDLNLTADRAGGYLVRNRIRERVWALNLSWDLLTPQDVMEIMAATAAAEFDVCFDAPTPTFEAKAKMYCGPVEMELVIYNDETKIDEKSYKLTLDLIEV